MAMRFSTWQVALSTQAVLAQASWVGIKVIIGYRAIGDGADPVFLGLLASTLALPGLLMALPAGLLADRFGGSGMSFAGLLFAAFGTAIVLMVPGAPVLLAASAIIGLGQLLVMVGQQAFAAHISNSASVDSAFGILTVAMSIGQFIGPPAVTLVASLASPGALPDTTLGLLVCLGFNALATPSYFLLRRTDASLRKVRQQLPAVPTGVTGILRAPGLWRSLVVSGAVVVTVDLMYTFVPVWAVQQNITAVVVGLLLALRAAVSVLSRLGLARLTERFGRKAMLISSIAAAALSLAVLPLVGPVGAIGVMVGMGLGLGIPQPLTMAWAVSLTAASSHGAVLGLRMTVNLLAQVTLPVAVGTFAAPLGVLGIFWVNAALLSGAIAVAAGSSGPSAAPSAGSK